LFFLALLVLKQFEVDYSRIIAFSGALLFSVYPLNVEAVSFISARGDLVCALFMLLAMIFHIMSYKHLLYVLLAVVFYLLSTFSKEVAVAFLIIVLGFDISSRKLIEKTNLIRYSIYIISTIYYFLLRSQRKSTLPSFEEAKIDSPELLTSSTSVGVVDSVVDYWGIIVEFFSSYFFYVLKLVFPFKLNPYISEIPGGALFVILSFLLVIVIFIIFLLAVYKRNGVVSVSILWIFATLGPAVVVAIFMIEKIPVPYAERFLYIPSLAYCLLLSYLLIELGKRAKLQKLIMVLLVVLLISFLTVTIHGQGVWKNNLRLWKYISDRNPTLVTPYINYGHSLLEIGEYEKAGEQFLKSNGSNIKDSSEQKILAAHNLAIYYYRAKENENAKNWFDKALSINPDYIGTYSLYMSAVALSVNDIDGAEKNLLKSIAVGGDPRRLADSHHLLGQIYFNKYRQYGHQDFLYQSRQHLSDAIKYDGKKMKSHLLLALVYASLNDRENMREHARIVLNHSSDERMLSQARMLLAN